jgi:glucose-1-phosphate thymidylyltransferase
MKIVIPMAGMGTRMRPHTLTIPKPLIPLAGKPIVQRLVEGIAEIASEPIDEIAFVIGRFGKEVEEKLHNIADSLNAKSSIYYQDVAQGTGHAVWCASESLKGNVVVAFADTLFYADFKLETELDGIIWAQKVKNPESFGVITTDTFGVINGFVEKPKEFISDLAIIGIYYFKDGAKLQNHLQNLIDNDFRGNNEYQLTDALENMRQEGVEFGVGQVNEWLDCGNKEITVTTHSRVLQHNKDENIISEKAQIKNSKIIPPCYIGNDSVITDSEIGPNVSIGNNTILEKALISNSIIQDNTQIVNSKIYNSMIGNHVKIEEMTGDFSIGDYCSLKK